MTKPNIKLSKEKIALALIVVAALTNPLSNQFVVDGAVNGLIFLSREIGVYATVIASVYVMIYILWNMWASREKTNATPKGRTKKQKFIET